MKLDIDKNLMQNINAYFFAFLYGLQVFIFTNGFCSIPLKGGVSVEL